MCQCGDTVCTNDCGAATHTAHTSLVHQWIYRSSSQFAVLFIVAVVLQTHLSFSGVSICDIWARQVERPFQVVVTTTYNRIIKP